MKKKFTLIAFAVVLVLSVFACAACNLNLLFESDDSFPYDVAVSRGEEGSRGSWLSSLDPDLSGYRRAYDEACADGSFTGTYFDFLQTLDLEGDGAYVQRALRSVVSVYAHFEPASRNEKSYVSMGSGVVYSLDIARGEAYIVTNYHVIYSPKSVGTESIAHVSDEITVSFYGSSSEIAMSYVGGAMEYDIAVLRVKDCTELQAEDGSVFACEVIAANSDAITAGERTYAIGNAEGTGMSVTEGVVSVTAEYIDVYAANERDLLNLLEIRTDAAVNHGNSGGGLFNAFGELIGIVNARDETDGILGFGYAIPVNLALSVAQNIIDTCAANSRAYGGALARLGLTVRTEESRSVFDEKTGKIYIEEKVVIEEAEYRKAGDNAGLKAGDTFISAKLTSSRGGVPYERTVEITRMFKLTNLLFEVRRGDTLEITYSRNNQVSVCTIEFTNSSDFEILN